ncbi:MAG: DEAD/DEAH box helicase [Snowella sp.]|nr:DEAD/DEAH box helicase [Snowella sp.]
MIPSVVANQIKNCIADYLRTTFHPTTDGFENLIHRFLQTPNQYYRGPYINIGLPFQSSDRQEEPFPDIPLGFQPHRHQAIAFERLSAPRYQSTIVATGTGSGKTECFLLPILEHCRQQQKQKGIKAILIYPMNALATDQAKRIAQLIDKHSSLRGKITAGLYVGDQEDRPMQVMTDKQIITDRYTLRNNPPDILLTNYKMLDLLLMQPENQSLWRENKPETLKYLVVDEFHTFDGAQGTDLACLLRRLKYRLKTPNKHLVCIGTSATLGSEESKQEMLHYAQDIFQEVFETDALITESRLTVQEFLGQNDLGDLLMVYPPRPEQLLDLQPETYANPTEFIRTQAELWLQQHCPVEQGPVSTEWQLALGKKLKQLPLIHNLLRFFDDRGKGILVPRTYAEVSEKLEGLLGITPNSEPDYLLALIDSLLSLMAIARTEVKKHDGTKIIVPWVNLRVQVWFRELKRMVASIEVEPQLLFSDDLKPDQLGKTLPVMHCRSCGATGWAGLRPQQDVDKLLLNNLQDFYKAFFARRRSPNLAFIFPCHDSQQQENIKQFCPQCLTLNAPRRESCASCGHQNLIRVQVPDISTQETENGQKYTVSSSDCPFCKNPNGLSILGAQSASLTSAMIGVLFTSPFNSDKKLLTFSDSVQDAAHRAGFYNARTYNTTLRTAIAKSLRDAPENISLNEFIPYFSDYWQSKLSCQADFVATFLPNDLAWLREWDSFLQSDHQELSTDSSLIEKFLKPRLEWEIITQFGHRAAIGPSLERSGICSLQFSPEQLQQSAALLQQRLSNEIEPLREITTKDLYPYLLGFLHHLRLQGAILQPATKSYIQNASNVYLLGKNQHYMPNIGPSNPKPKFLANHSANAQHFETLAHRGKRSHWSEDWARRCLQAISLLLQDQLIEVLHQTLECLEAVGLLQIEKCGAGRAWGLPQSQLYFSLSAKIFACNQCGSSLICSDQETQWVQQMACLKQGCSGHYQAAPNNALSYYRQIYQQGEIKRIYALEHTGLLEREHRERLENRFIQGDRCCDPNLLSATSTLEMGINIGDLSSVVLCSIPPNTANFQQRLGRAGRTDGNAFATAIANGKAHDLYFYSNPVKMIQGNVNPAGCYLDAASILERQLAAFCLDSWVSEFLTTATIPKQLREILSIIGVTTEKGKNRTLRERRSGNPTVKSRNRNTKINGNLTGWSSNSKKSLS